MVLHSKRENVICGCAGKMRFGSFGGKCYFAGLTENLVLTERCGFGAKTWFGGFDGKT